MEYQNQIREAVFYKRPNRFLAEVELDGERELVHVKNTGRCRELLREGARVFLEESGNANRKTKHSLVAVYKGDMLYLSGDELKKTLGERWSDWKPAAGRKSLVDIHIQGVDQSVQHQLHHTARRHAYLGRHGLRAAALTRLTTPARPPKTRTRHRRNVKRRLSI